MHMLDMLLWKSYKKKGRVGVAAAFNLFDLNELAVLYFGDKFPPENFS